MGLAGRDGQIGVADASKEGAALLFKTVLVFFFAFFQPTFVFSIPPPGTVDAESHFIVQQDGQVRL
jgi:hypothetical protein